MAEPARRPPPGGAAAALVYVAVIFLFNELRLALVLRWMPQRRQRVERFMATQARRMLAAVQRLSGLQYSFHTNAAALPRRFILVTNHQSLADILMLVAAFPRHPLKFVAKRSLQRGIPTLSKCLRYGCHALIDRRGAQQRTRRALLRLARLERRPRSDSRFPPCSLALFPEGTRSRDGRLGRFHRAGLRLLAEQARLPIVVAALDGGTGISRLRALRNLARVHYRIKVLQVHPPAPDRRAAAEALAQARQAIAVQVAAWRRAAVSPPASAAGAPDLTS